MSRRRNTKSELHKLRAKLKVKPLHETLQREVIRATKIAEGDKILDAALLGIGKTTIYRKLEQAGRR
jgi:transcriptional regulator of acetoin/glycerol metabolism